MKADGTWQTSLVTFSIFILLPLGLPAGLVPIAD